MGRKGGISKIFENWLSMTENVRQWCRLIRRWLIDYQSTILGRKGEFSIFLEIDKIWLKNEQQWCRHRGSWFFEYQSAILGRKGGIFKFLEIDWIIRGNDADIEECDLLSIRVLYRAIKGEFYKVLKIASVWLKKAR